MKRYNDKHVFPFATGSMKWVVPVFMALMVLFVQACKGGKASKDENAVAPAAGDGTDTLVLTTGQVEKIGIQAQVLEKGPVSQEILAKGMVELPPQHMFSIATPLEGYVKKIYVLPGQQVRKGERLATMTGDRFLQLQQDYLVAKSKLKWAEAEYQRQKDLNETKSSSDKVTQQALADWEQLKVSVRTLQQKLLLCQMDPDRLTADNISNEIGVYAPKEGVVTGLYVNQGKFVGPQETMMELMDKSELHLVLSASQQDLPYFYPGQHIKAFSNVAPYDKELPAKVVLINPRISQDGSSEIHCHFEGNTGQLIPGMYMTAKVIGRGTMAYLAPTGAVVGFEGKSYFFVEKEMGTYVMIETKVLQEENGQVAIDVPEAYRTRPVVVKGAYTLLMMLRNKGGEEE